MVPYRNHRAPTSHSATSSIVHSVPDSSESKRSDLGRAIGDGRSRISLRSCGLRGPRTASPVPDRCNSPAASRTALTSSPTWLRLPSVPRVMPARRRFGSAGVGAPMKGGKSCRVVLEPRQRAADRAARQQLARLVCLEGARAAADQRIRVAHNVP